MDLNCPHGPQKIDILKKIDPLHVKCHKKKFTSKGQEAAELWPVM